MRATSPTSSGLVTDLDDHLVSRALTSLRAELRRRERLLAEAAAQDLDGYARSPSRPGEPLPRLVVVVDELRTLVDEVPEFVSGLVRLAAQGRSLGIHLVLATQRPAGAVTAEVQANVSLRIAFRVRDRSDSVAIVEDGAAADIRPQTPGRAVVRGADGRLRTFQSAMFGPAAAQPRPGVRLEVLGVEDRGAVTAAGPAAQPTSTAPGSRVAGSDGTGGPTTVAHRAAAAEGRRHDADRAEGHRGPPAHGRRRPSPPLAACAASAPDVCVIGHPPGPAGRRPARQSGETAGPVSVAPDRVVAVGLVDEPDAQRVRALRWDADDGTWLLPGRLAAAGPPPCEPWSGSAVSALDPLPSTCTSSTPPRPCRTWRCSPTWAPA